MACSTHSKAGGNGERKVQRKHGTGIEGPSGPDVYTEFDVYLSFDRPCSLLGILVVSVFYLFKTPAHNEDQHTGPHNSPYGMHSALRMMKKLAMNFKLAKDTSYVSLFPLENNALRNIYADNQPYTHTPQGLDGQCTWVGSVSCDSTRFQIYKAQIT